LITEAGKASKAPARRDPRLPPLDLLEADDRLVADEEEIRAKAEIIVETLAQFGLPVTVREVRRGPAVTQFGLEPGYIERVGPNGEPRLHKVRVSQISALADDLALALAAPTLRIEAPVPGRPIVGVEVPNDQVAVVRLRGVMESRAFTRLRSPLALALGRDVAGAPVVADLAAMPHLLIAGTTGSGKSVAISAMATCLVMNNTPEDLRLVMIDPKMVELVRFNGLPHLYGHVEVELERIAGVLRWVVREMDERYKRFAAVEARHLEDYNRKMRRRRRPPLPHIVILVDELADLMMMAPQETEHTLTRLAQMARATGIHLVVATQRPSTDVITGLIKANFPARISFAVVSQVDSRVILDTVGAEQLLGRGDMLFLNPELGHPVRLQGCFVSDREIEAVVSYWRTHWEREEEEAPWEEWLRRHAAPGERRDDLLEAAIALVRETGGASASLLQRRLRIGYPRAARLMDELEAMGIIGPPEAGGRLREVLNDQGGGGGRG
ncbi:MAG: DNA translocase FtsK, partial [Chloroflexi bacterium]